MSPPPPRSPFSQIKPPSFLLVPSKKSQKISTFFSQKFLAMPDSIPSCFRGVGGGPPPSTAAGPTLTTSVYETPLGLAAFSWSRTVLGLLLRADLRLSLDDGDEDVSGDQDRPLSFKIRPWLFFHRRGSKRFHLRTHSIDFAWDLTRAKFPSAGGPEPVAGFFVSVAVDGEIILVAGDLDDLAFKKAKLKKRDLDTSLISRKEHVTMKEDRSYKTQARFGGKERSISIDLGGEMSLEVDGKQILQIRRLRWKFRGSERVQLEGGDRIQLSWDLHNWLFTPKDGGGGDGSGDRSSSSTGSALFVFRFESEETEQGHFGKKGEEHFGKEGVYKGTLGGYFGKNRNWSESSSGGGGGENGKKKGKNGSGSNKKKSLLKTSSSSSSSSASSSASSTVMEWASPEENELRSKEGFSLLVYAWKS